MSVGDVWGSGGELVVTVPASNPVERRYALGVVLTEWLGLDFALETGDGPDVSIALPGDASGRTVKVPDRLLATDAADWLTGRALPARPLARVEPRSMPVLFGAPLAGGRAWEMGPGGIRLAVDVFGSAFYLLAAVEEIASPVRDGHDRFPASAALPVQEGFIERPIVDEYVELLWAAMHSLWPRLRRRQAAFRLRLTHDIDRPWGSWGRSAASVALSAGVDVLRRRDPGLAARRLASWVDARSGRFDRDPFATYDVIMDTAERHGLRSVCYFMAGNSPGDPDFRYRLADPPFAGILRRIHDRGHEVGLHASYASHGSAARLRTELEALRVTCHAAGFEQDGWGVRQHYLRFASPATWRHQADVGLVHDSTLGFAERIGFRAGTCREYPVFDAVERRPIGLRERPLVAMDSTLLGYMGLGLEEAAREVRVTVDRCRRLGGDAVLLFHNDTLAWSSVRASYRELVEDLARPVPEPEDRGWELPHAGT